MLKIKSIRKTYLLPSGWHEISFRQFLLLSQAETYLQQLSILSRLDAYQLEQTALPADKSLKESIFEMLSQPDISDIIIPDNIHVPQSLYACTFGQKEDALSAFVEHKENELLAAPAVLGIYCLPYSYNADRLQQRIDRVIEYPCLPCLKIFYDFKEQLNEIQEDLRLGLYSIPETDEEKSAKVRDIMSIWGTLSTAFAIAENDFTKLEAVFRMPVSEAHTYIKYRNHQQYAAWKLNDEIRRKQESDQR